MTSDIDEAKAGPAPGEADDQRRRWLDRLHLWALVELFVLSGFAIAQPLLEVTGKSPDFFLFRRADRLDIVAPGPGGDAAAGPGHLGFEVRWGWSASGSGAWPTWPPSPGCS